MASEGVELYSAWFCPFAQRAWVAAEAKKMPYKLIEVDPYAKPPELMSVNPRGLVPGLKHGEKNVFESMVVMEYIDEAFDGPDLMPKDPYLRAVARIWMDQVNRKIVPTFYRYLQKQDKVEQEAEKEQLLSALKEFAEALTKYGGSEGPFFFGGELSLVDICLLPWTLRLEVLAHYRNFELPGDESFGRLKAWNEACKKHPSVSVTIADEQKLREIYKRYADNTATSEVAVAVNQNKPLP